ncbi:MAG: DUF1743 domain-containing protein [Thermoplasmata archaeon]
MTLLEVIDAVEKLGVDLIGEPHLVRLNPNVPTKTRGNGALAVEFGHGLGRRHWVGEGPDGSRWGFRSATPLSDREREDVLGVAWAVVQRTTRWEGAHTEPALIACLHRPAASFYWHAVSRWVETSEVEPVLRSVEARVHWSRSPQGLVGAAAAVAWPAQRATWELLTYRSPERIGHPRRVNAESVRRAQREFPELFHCFDRETRRLLVAPHTNCPILYGLRARSPRRLRHLPARIGSELVYRSFLFKTNQATGDHLQDRSIAELRPYDAARVTGTIASRPIRGRGGHVRLVLEDAHSVRIEGWAFEPSKTLAGVAATVIPGDQIALWGGIGKDPVFRIEGIELLALVPRALHTRPPRCHACHRRARSLGRSRGYRCPGCHRRFPPESARTTRPAPAFGPGVYHPTPSARRHLAPVGPDPG